MIVVRNGQCALGSVLLDDVFGEGFLDRARREARELHLANRLLRRVLRQVRAQKLDVVRDADIANESALEGGTDERQYFGRRPSAKRTERWALAISTHVLLLFHNLLIAPRVMLANPFLEPLIRRL